VTVACLPEEFAGLVTEALDDLPPDLGELMHNVAVVVDDDSPPGDLFGYYDGVPLTERGNEYGAVLPDRIVLFRQTLCAAVEDPEELREEIVVTVVHEVAHHFGIDDDRLHELGWA
jgi:predicted Zn-dependent protease with MMP-like domain